MRGTAALLVLAALAAAVAADDWKVTTKGVGTFDFGIGFSSPLVGYTAADANGVGPEILKTVDGGKTWAILPNVSFGGDLLLTGLAANNNSIVIAAPIGGEMSSQDAGATWTHSMGGAMSQSVHSFDNDATGMYFGVTGQFSSGAQGVAISQNGGKLFVRKPAAVLFTEARYGAFTSNTRFVVAAGAWPEAPPGPPPPPPPPSELDAAHAHAGRRPAGAPAPARTGRRRSVYQDENGKFPRSYAGEPRGESGGNGYYAQIVVTNDGGSTWKTTFAQNNTFYFNGVACSQNNPNICCAVGEGEVDNGARIYCSYDGAQTWNRTFFMAGTSKQAFSLMEIRFAGDDIWAVGGELSSEPVAWFLHSQDDGKTWINKAQLPQMYGSIVGSVTMVNPQVGYAVVDNVITQQADIATYFP